MIKIMFVCLGNICRSPMAEFVLKDMVDKSRRRYRNRVYRLLDFSENPRDIADPWYTENFD